MPVPQYSAGSDPAREPRCSGAGGLALSLALCDEERGIPCKIDYWGRPGTPRKAPPLESWLAETYIRRMVARGIMTEGSGRASTTRAANADHGPGISLTGEPRA